MGLIYFGTTKFENDAKLWADSFKTDSLQGKY